MTMRRYIYNIIRLIALLLASILISLSISSCRKEISVTPPDIPPPNGYILINSNPAHFDIYLNNKERRRATPDSLTWLSTGTYLITLKKELYKDTSFTIDVVEGEKQSVYIDIAGNPSMRGNLVCTSNPPNAEIFINDSSTGFFTPHTFNILPGKYNIRYHIKNHRDAEVIASVTSSSNVTAKSSLVDTTLWSDYTISNSKIPSNNLTCVSVAPGDIIYAGTSDRGFFSFEETNNNWIPYHSALTNTVNCITIDKSGILYAGTKSSLIYLVGKTWIEYDPTNSNLPSYNVHSIVVNNEGNCYIGTDKGITLLKDWKDFTPSYTQNGKKVIPMITALTLDSGGNLWAALNNYGIAEYSSNLWSVYSSGTTNLINSNITTLASPSSAEVWAGFDNGSVFGNGLSYFDGSSWNKVFPIPATSRTNTIFIDRDNIKWVGTNQGLIKFTVPANVTTFNYDNTGLDITNVTGISQDSNGNIWIATSSGLFKYKGAR